MEAQCWTYAIQQKLKKIGKEKGYKTNRSGKDIPMSKGKKDFTVRPDIIWEKDGRIEMIFEIDQFTKPGYSKTIYGSMLQGLLLAKHYTAKFIEIVPKDENGRKACMISEKLENMFKAALPQFCVIRVQKSNARINPKGHTGWNLKQKLDQIENLKNWKAWY
jgi:hypothetical protein